LFSAAIEATATSKKNSPAYTPVMPQISILRNYSSIPSQLIEAAVTSALISPQEVVQKYLRRSMRPRFGMLAMLLVPLASLSTIASKEACKLSFFCHSCSCASAFFEAVRTSAAFFS
jgi:hypothetical protein